MPVPAQAYDALCLVEKVQACFVRFADGDPDATAAHGIGPLKLGVRAPLHAILDLGCGRYTEELADPEWQLQATTQDRFAGRLFACLNRGLWEEGTPVA